MIVHFKAKEHRFLSNMYPCRIIFDGMVFNSVEHAYVAAKTTDINIRKQVQAIINPREVKKFGKTIVLRSDWDAVKLEIMRDLVKQKFLNKVNENLSNLLLKTGDEHIQEGNWWCDYFWGVSIRNDSTKGRGENNLGKIIMECRNLLDKESSQISESICNEKMYTHTEL